MSARQQEAEDFIVHRARENGGEYLMGYGDTSAVMRLTEKGIGHWEQRNPFIATFVLHQSTSARDGAAT